MNRPALLLVPVLLALSACAHKPVEPAVKIIEVRVPVPVPCDPARPAKPERTPRAVLASLPLSEAVRRLLVETDLSTAYERELEAALDGCASAGA